MSPAHRASAPPAAAAASAPGKVLLAGGYLVLDRAHTGLVVALDARLHAAVRDIPTHAGVTLNEIVVASPQFPNAVWEYGYRLAEHEGGVAVTQLRVDADLHLNRNVFVETVLGYALTYIATASSPHITPAAVTLFADNDYYSTPADRTTGPGSAPRFHHFDVPLSHAHKTGLGSSAALVTALTAALLTYYLPRETFDLDSAAGKRRLHNLAQVAHCAAQGKVGSGFDVASAVYGSCRYRRFSPAILSHYVEPGAPGFAPQLRDLVDETGAVGPWDTEILKDEVRIPAGLRLVMCDVTGGSQTPGMVKQVLAWRKTKPAEADAIWTELQQTNDALVAGLRVAAEESAEDADYSGLRAHFDRMRRGIRVMSEKSGVPIEPPSQTQLIDACERVPGVIGGVVPGAGGYDAIALLIEDNDETVAGLKKLFAEWNNHSAADDEEEDGGGRVSMLGVREETEGVRVEDPNSY